MVRSAEAGVTLIEVLVASVIMGIAGVAVVGILGNSIVLSDHASRRADVGQALQDAAEVLKDPIRTPYVPCSSYAPPDGDRDDDGNDDDGVLVEVKPTLFWDADGNQYQPACGPSGDDGLQLIEVQAESSEGGRDFSAVLQVTKRQP